MDSVEQDVFREVIGRFASGVTIITTTADGRDHGTTASAVASLSMEPPMLLVCLNTGSATRAAVLVSGSFGVNILAEDQGQVAYQFARRGADRFAGVGVVRGESGVPLIVGALAQLECEVSETVTGGTHTVLLAYVRQARAGEGTPLTYFRGRFGRLASAPAESAYREAREAEQVFEARCTIEIGVIDRVVGRGRPLELGSLRAAAARLGSMLAGPAPVLPEFLLASHEFHLQLIELAGAGPLRQLYDRLGVPAFWARTMGTRTWWQDFDVAHHGPLLDALADDDAVRAKALVYAHTEQVKALVRDALG